jgi:hypothetical protein
MPISLNNVAIMDALLTSNLELSITLVLVGYSCISKRLSTNFVLAMLLLYQTYSPKNIPTAIIQASWALVLYIIYIRIAEFEKRVETLEKNMFKIKRGALKEIPEGRFLRMAEEISRLKTSINISNNTDPVIKKGNLMQNIMRFLY